MGSGRVEVRCKEVLCDAAVHNDTTLAHFSTDAVDIQPVDTKLGKLSLLQEAAAAVVSTLWSECEGRVNTRLATHAMYRGRLGPERRTERRP